MSRVHLMTYGDVARIVKVVDPGAASLGDVVETVIHAQTDLARAISGSLRQTAVGGLTLQQLADVVDSTAKLLRDLLFQTEAGGETPLTVLEILGFRPAQEESNGSEERE